MAEMKSFKTIGVVGSGQMGSGIAQLAATHGFDVWVLDTDQDALSRATKSISSSIQRLVSKGQLSQVGNSLFTLKLQRKWKNKKWKGEIILPHDVDVEFVGKLENQLSLRVNFKTSCWWCEFYSLYASLILWTAVKNLDPPGVVRWSRICPDESMWWVPYTCLGGGSMYTFFL